MRGPHECSRGWSVRAAETPQLPAERVRRSRGSLQQLAAGSGDTGQRLGSFKMAACAVRASASRLFACLQQLKLPD